MKAVPLVVAVLALLMWADLGHVQEPKSDKTIDQHALKAPAEAEASLPKLAEYLVRPCKSDRDKTRAIYRWITDRIAYDAESFFAQMQGDNNAEGVLKSRKGVCAGYANLFADLAGRVELEVVTVSGFAKGVDYDPEKRLTKANHAWTAVHLDGAWRLVDATWGAGYINGKEFVKRFSGAYFLVAPERLAFSHLPTEEKWQLLKAPLGLEQFLEQPKVSRGLWDLGVMPEMVRKTIADKKFRELVHVYTITGQATTLVSAPLTKQLRAGTKYTFEFKSDDFAEIAGFQNSKPAPFAKKGNVFRGTLALQQGQLKIGGRPKEEKNRYTGILEYVVE